MHTSSIHTDPQTHTSTDSSRRISKHDRFHIFKAGQRACCLCSAAKASCNTSTAPPSTPPFSHYTESSRAASHVNCKYSTLLLTQSPRARRKKKKSISALNWVTVQVEVPIAPCAEGGQELPGTMAALKDIKQRNQSPVSVPAFRKSSPKRIMSQNAGIV